MAERDWKAEPLLQRLGRAVAAVRAEAGLTQEDVAQEAGLSARFVQMLERGTANPSYLRLSAIAAAIGIRLPDLIARAESTRSQR